MRVIIIEDNELDQLILTNFIEEDADLVLSGIYADAIHAISVIQSVQPDLIFLDVELPGMTGIEFLQAVKDVPQIIMITSHAEFALDAFENEVTDFIVKPVLKERFLKAVQKAKQMDEWLSLESNEDAHIYVRVDRENLKLNLNDIVFVEAMGDYIRFQLSDKKVMVLSTMKAIGTKLPEDMFVRNHRSFYTNISKIDSFNSKEIKIGDKIIPVSRRGQIELKAIFNKID